MTVSARYLLEGFWYALEQCGRLLHDAIGLYELGRFGTAAGLAMLAREEMGKARILFKLSGEVEAGRALSQRELAETLEDHLEKQTHGQLSVVLSGAQGTQLDKLIRATMDPSHPDFEAATAELDEVRKRKMRRIPDERHSLRQRAMYVDPTETGEGWNRPAGFTKDESRDQLFQAMNDYSTMFQNLKYAERYEKLRERLSDWPARPELPERRWPRDGEDSGT